MTKILDKEDDEITIYPRLNIHSLELPYIRGIIIGMFLGFEAMAIFISVILDRIDSLVLNLLLFMLLLVFAFKQEGDKGVR